MNLKKIEHKVSATAKVQQKWGSNSLLGKYYGCLQCIYMAMHIGNKTLNTYQGLHNCMICCIHVCVEWERAFTITVKSCIAFRCNDPILKKSLTQFSISKGHLKISKCTVYCGVNFLKIL